MRFSSKSKLNEIVQRDETAVKKEEFQRDKRAELRIVYRMAPSRSTIGNSFTRFLLAIQKTTTTTKSTKTCQKTTALNTLFVSAFHLEHRIVRHRAARVQSIVANDSTRKGPRARIT